jgi:DNA-directed RNA polymerase subunit RPC12/RpoP
LGGLLNRKKVIMQEEYFCPECGLLHRLVRHDTPETWVRCIQCGNRFQIKNAAQQSVQRIGGDAPLEDSPFETGIRRGAVVTPPANR